MAHTKKLYLSKNMEDLEQLTIIPDCCNKSMRILLNTAQKLYTTAEKHRLDGDEEMAYVAYMKYFNILNDIRKKPDYPNNKAAVREKLGDKEANRRKMDALEKINDSLRDRYRALRQVATPPTIISSSLDHIGDTVISNGAILSSSSPKEYAQLGIISCESLFQRMQEKTVLVMDCRSIADYENSHLTYNWAFNVPEEIISSGMSAGRLQARLSSQSKALWASRSVKETVVLMDWNTKDAEPASNTAIAILLDILKNWDPDVTYRAPIQILESGYEYFIMMYPSHCTNPSVQAPKQNNNDIEPIDDIEYPSLSDITMKEDITSYAPGGRPRINRASKLAAMRTMNLVSNEVKSEQAKPIDEILRDQANLLQRAEHNDQLLIDANRKWNTIFELKQLQAEGVELSPSDQELLYNILQLENTAEDYKIENNHLREDLNRYKEEQAIKKTTPNGETEATRCIESKILERQRLDEKHAHDRIERERLLAIARETKKLYNPPSIMSSTITPPPPPPPPPANDTTIIPSLDHDSIVDMQNIKNGLGTLLIEQAAELPRFDRGMKPPSSTQIVKPVEKSQPLVRDFSPVIGHNVGRGLTGLKNLGNTCYMNSILQCLSHTPQLTEYCITDKYKNYISRSNKTNGQVIEEVAALIKELWNGQYKCVASRDLRYVVGQYQKIFRGVDQQDSHEFLTILMDWLHSDLQTLNVKQKRETITASEKAWMEFTKAKESLILHLFYGQMKSTVKCVTCNRESATYECFSNLSLELPENKELCYLNQCMDMYFSGERIHGWNCPNCKTKREAIKKLDISKLPPVLVVHLKRFHADPIQSGAYIKKQNYLRFPLENLEMTPYIARAESRTVTPKIYQLYAVSNHYGTMEGGHYTAFCKSANYKRWYKFDDQIVSTLDTSSVVSSAAYILFYTWLPHTQVSSQ